MNSVLRVGLGCAHGLRVVRDLNRRYIHATNAVFKRPPPQLSNVDDDLDYQAILRLGKSGYFVTDWPDGEILEESGLVNADIYALGEWARMRGATHHNADDLVYRYEFTHLDQTLALMVQRHASHPQQMHRGILPHAPWVIVHTRGQLSAAKTPRNRVIQGQEYQSILSIHRRGHYDRENIIHAYTDYAEDRVLKKRMFLGEESMPAYTRALFLYNFNYGLSDKDLARFAYRKWFVACFPGPEPNLRHDEAEFGGQLPSPEQLRRLESKKSAAEVSLLNRALKARELAQQMAREAMQLSESRSNQESPLLIEEGAEPEDEAEPDDPQKNEEDNAAFIDQNLNPDDSSDDDHPHASESETSIKTDENNDEQQSKPEKPEG